MDEGDSLKGDLRFFTVILWLCAAASVYLLFCPAAFERRAKTLRVEQDQVALIQTQFKNTDLTRWRDALKSDPSAIEQEARRLGWGRPNERAYVLSAAELSRARSRLAEPVVEKGNFLLSLRDLLAMPILYLLGGAILVFFMKDLRIPDPDAVSSTKPEAR